ncbi:hypothetical protein FE810_12345 [Thalassotalea litorea]|uniref:Uncharacterized protein n=1 Tax=Thalassotalea litorea TaxID=2020715 RepID=A0A5R9ILK9_9GAMM|nr:hypothetical protein [Thalassotalea litorea]TLU64096.1 hypothetical protein FE810_12345 [Thalassotalea litorea]
MFINITIVFAWLPSLVLLATIGISLINFLTGSFSEQQLDAAIHSPLQVGLLIIWIASVVLSFWSMCSVCFGLNMGFVWRMLALLIGTLAYLVPLAFFLPLLASYSLQALLTIVLSLLALAALIHLIHAYLHLRLILSDTKAKVESGK